MKRRHRLVGVHPDVLEDVACGYGVIVKLQGVSA